MSWSGAVFSAFCLGPLGPLLSWPSLPTTRARVLETKAIDFDFIVTPLSWIGFPDFVLPSLCLARCSTVWGSPTFRSLTDSEIRAALPHAGLAGNNDANPFVGRSYVNVRPRKTPADTVTFEGGCLCGGV